MISHTLKVTGQRIFGAEKITLATDANNTVRFKFDFDKEWRKFSQKAAVFGRIDQEPLIVAIDGNFVIVPWEVLTKPEPFFFSVMAYDEKSLLSTKKAVIAVGDSFIPDSILPDSPSETIFDKFGTNLKQEYEEKLATLEDSYKAEIKHINQELNTCKENFANAANELEAAQNTIKGLEEENDALRQGHSECENQISEKERELEIVKGYIQNLESDVTVLESELHDCRLRMDSLETEKEALAARSAIADEWDTFWSKARGPVEMFASLSPKGVPRPFGSDMPVLNTINATDIFGFAKGVTGLRRVSLRCDRVGYMKEFAKDNTLLEYVKLINLGDTITTMEDAFLNATYLETIDTVFDFSNLSNASRAFYGCSSLKNIRFVENTIGVSLSFEDSPLLTLDSLISILNGLNPESPTSIVFNAGSKDVLDASDFSFNDGTTTYYKSTAFKKAIAAKGWVMGGF